MSAKYQYVTNCVNSDGPSITAMVDDARDITRRTFLKHVDRAELRDVETQLSYVQHPSHGLTMAGDFHVSYHRSKYHGAPCVFFTYSAIEYVFADLSASECALYESRQSWERLTNGAVADGAELHGDRV